MHQRHADTRSQVRRRPGFGLALLSGLAATLLAACGGGGGSDEPPATPQACAPNNPYRGDATMATTVGSLSIEKAWMRSHLTRNYLWYAEMPSVDASLANYSDEADIYGSLENYFNALLTPAITTSGALKDQFSFTYPTLLWDQLINSGSSLGYGIDWYFASNTAPRGIRVAYVHAGSPAATAGIQRGDTLVTADNVGADDNTPSGVNTINSALFPSTTSLHSFRFSRGAAVFDRQLTATNVTLVPVEHRVLSVNGSNVGYLLFNDHTAASEQFLITAIQALKTANITDLVLDLRYNSGGYVYIASELAYMIAGQARTANKVFEGFRYNNKRTGENSNTPFFDTSCLLNTTTFNCTANNPLPTLDLPRVFVLSGGSTCSASESVINGLRGVDVDVRLIGNTTCGKPYGFTGQDNCGITYFPIEFQGVNHKGFGDFADGFVPATVGNTSAAVTGCTVSDDLDHALGDPAEGRLAAALQHRLNGSCPVAVGRESPLAVTRVPLGVQRPRALSERYGRLPNR